MKSNNSSILKSLEVDGFRAEIEYDVDPINPRKDCDNLSTIISWSRHNLADKKEYNFCYALSEDQVREMFSDILAILPVYIYDHGGISINTTGFSCSWDSCQIGWAFITKDGAERMGCLDWSTEKLIEAIKSEISEYDQAIRGEVYSYTVFDRNNLPVHTVGGFFDFDDAELEAMSDLRGRAYYGKTCRSPLSPLCVPVVVHRCNSLDSSYLCSTTV